MEITTLYKDKLRMRDVVLYCYICSVIITEATMYGVLQNLYKIGINNFDFQILSLIIGILTIVTLVFSKNFKIRIKKNNVRTLIMLFIYLLIYGLVNINRITTFFVGLAVPFFVACMIVIIYEDRNLYKKFFSFYGNIVLVLAGISLLFYVFGTTLHIVSGTPMHFMNNGWWYEGTNYYYLSFINNWQTIQIFGITVVRNIGIFMEAPGYAVILQFAFWWELFGKNKINKKRVAILLTTIFTTFSAKAYISATIIIIMYLYSGQATLSRNWKKIRRVLLPILFIGAVGVSFQMLSIRNISINGENPSLAIRISDYLAAFDAWKDSPIFGCGFYNLEKLYTYYSSFRKSGTSTAGIINVLAYGGIYMAAFYIIPFIRYVKCNMHDSNKFTIWSFLVLILFSFITGNVQYSYLMLLFMAFGYMLGINRQ